MTAVLPLYSRTDRPGSLHVVPAVMGGKLPETLVETANRAARRTLTRGEGDPGARREHDHGHECGRARARRHACAHEHVRENERARLPSTVLGLQSRPGEIGILHSNVRAWRRALAAGMEWALVLEIAKGCIECQ